MRLPVLILAAIALSACGSQPQPAAKTEAAPPPPPSKPIDDSNKLPQEGLLGARVVPDHILDLPKMPGGTLGDYQRSGKKYQIFIIETPSNQSAALLLLDLKGALNDAEYIPNFGGYFGMNGSRRIFAFAKLQYLTGVADLSKDAADPIARVLAARLH